MSPIHTLRESSLRFHIEDAQAAIAARPDGAKVPQYWQEIQDCRAELARREQIRSRRDMVKAGPVDPLTARRISTRFKSCLPLFPRTRSSVPLWRRQDARDAAYTLAFLRHCKTQQQITCTR